MTCAQRPHVLHEEGSGGVGDGFNRTQGAHSRRLWRPYNSFQNLLALGQRRAVRPHAPEPAASEPHASASQQNTHRSLRDTRGGHLRMGLQRFRLDQVCDPLPLALTRDAVGGHQRHQHPVHGRSDVPTHLLLQDGVAGQMGGDAVAVEQRKQRHMPCPYTRGNAYNEGDTTQRHGHLAARLGFWRPFCVRFKVWGIHWCVFTGVFAVRLFLKQLPATKSVMDWHDTPTDG